MNNINLDSIAAIDGSPCLTVVIPTSADPARTLETRATIQAAIAQAKQEIKTQLDAQTAALLNNQLQRAVDELDYSTLQEGLVIYAGPDVSQSYVLPVTVSAKVLIKDCFSIRDLLMSQ